MKVALDTSPLYMTRAGVARYVNGLLHGLGSLSHPDISIEPLVWPVANLDYVQPMRTIKTLYRELVWATVVAPVILKRKQMDILHITQRIPINACRGVKRLAKLHDCAVIRHPERFRAWTRFTSKRYIRMFTKVDQIICNSKFTADEAVSLLGISPKKLSVVYMGNSLAPIEKLVTPKQPSFSLPKEFFLFVGSLEPGKQLSLIGEVYSLAKAKGQTLPPLVIIGERWAGVPRETGVQSNWIYAGYQNDDVLMHCYQKARALIFPSMYEGFGFPVLEAMSLRCPVICSRVASLTEVGGKAAIYAEQTPEDYLRCITELLSSSSLNEDTISAGLQQAANFSWKKCAQQTLDIYRSMMT